MIEYDRILDYLVQNHYYSTTYYHLNDSIKALASIMLKFTYTLLGFAHLVTACVLHG